MKLWLDLEQTIISNWDDPVLCNIDKIRCFIHNNRPTEINIFSFAVFNNNDRDYFNATMRNWINDALGITINRVETVDDMMRVIFRHQGIQFDRFEFTTVWGKEKAFADWICFTEKLSGDFVLIDDVVDDVTIHRHRTNQHITTINVDRMK